MGIWPQWRGPNRDGVCPALPARLPTKSEFRWEAKLTSEGVGGIAATREFVIVGSRNASDSTDVFTCHRMNDGSEVWRISYPADGNLDYGNSPRATPLIVDDRVVLLGALGNLTVAELSTGKRIWQKSFHEEFRAEPPTWGFCGSPIKVDRQINGADAPMIVVQPGSNDASLVALDLASGERVWKSPGQQPGYASLILAHVGTTQQLIGYDKTSLGGWDIQGNRIWTVTPEIEGDFNVPTPIFVEPRLFVATENNGARLFEFDSLGKINRDPLYHCNELMPDTHSPAVVGDFICGISNGFYCLRKDNLTLVHELKDHAFDEYASIISDGKTRILVTTIAGEILLLEITAEECKIVGRLRITRDDEILSHPAIVDGQLIVRFGRKLVCLPLAD